MEVRKSIEIAAPPDVIWPYLIEPDKILQWYRTFRKFEYTSEGQSGEGTRIYIEEKAAGPLMKMNFTVTEWAEDKTIAIKILPGSGPKAYQQRWHLDPIPSGSKFTFWEEIKMPFGFIGKILESFGQRISENTVEEMLKDLKALAEVEKVGRTTTAA